MGGMNLFVFGQELILIKKADKKEERKGMGRIAPYELFQGMKRTDYRRRSARRVETTSQPSHGIVDPIPHLHSDSPELTKEFTKVKRERDDLLVRSQHLQSLLTEAQDTIAQQARELKTLRSALAEQDSLSIPVVAVNNDDAEVTSELIRYKRLSEELQAALEAIRKRQYGHDLKQQQQLDEGSHVSIDNRSIITASHMSIDNRSITHANPDDFPFTLCALQGEESPTQLLADFSMQVERLITDTAPLRDHPVEKPPPEGETALEEELVEVYAELRRARKELISLKHIIG
ncbi:hypothetical protein BC832DRAFT_538745 [Gaertneriomyces semiglobifer]|nr:hypothetical protein BC832DRAFT_538745 [Gaertneriomyces semiglobifer]